MGFEQFTPQDPRIQHAVTELEGLITNRYPEARFELSRGEDPEGVYLTATVDTDDLTTVLDIVGEQLVDLQVNHELPLYIVPVRPLERALRELHQPQPRIRPQIEIEPDTTPVRP